MAGGGVGYGGVPPLRFAEGGALEYADYPSTYPDLWNTWGTSAQDTYDRTMRLGQSPEYKAYWDALPAHLKNSVPKYAEGPNDPNWAYQASQQMNQWEVSQGENPFPVQTPPRNSITFSGNVGSRPVPGTPTPTPGTPPGGGTPVPKPGGGGTTPPPGGGGTTPPGGGGTGGGNWGGGFGQKNPITSQPGYTPPEFPNLAFGYPWIPEELKALRAQLGLVPDGGGISTVPPAVSTKEVETKAKAKAGGIMSLMGRNR